MWQWIKNLFVKVEDVVEKKIITELHLRILIDDLFAVLQAGVAFTPSPFDNAALAALEEHIDKAQLAAVLTQRLRDLINLHD